MRSFDDVLTQVDELAARFAAGAEKHDRDGSFAFENVAAIKTVGLPRSPVPAEYGGDGFDLLQCTQILQRLAHGDASTALGMAMHFHVIGSLAENNIWAGDAFARLCRDVVKSGALVNSAASEPEMGSPSRGGLPATKALATDGGFVLNGRKSWVTNAPALGYFLISAAHEEAAGIFAVKAGTPGLSLIDTWSASLSLRASGSFDVELKDVFVPAQWHVEQRAPGQVKRGALPAGWATCAFAAVYLGVGEAALQAMVDYSKQRVPTALGKPIAELPHIQRGIGQMDVALRSAREALHSAAHKWVTQPEARVGMEADLAAAKYLCTNAAITVTDIALRTAGASGLARRLPLERYFRDARAGLMHPPQDDRALEIIGRTAIASAE